MKNGPVHKHHSRDFLREAAHPVVRGDRADAFVRDPGDGPARTPDDLAQEVAEGFITSATSGEEAGEELANAEVPEEEGGPFVETTELDEFAFDTDASNPEDAEPEPFPLPNSK